MQPAKPDTSCLSRRIERPSPRGATTPSVICDGGSVDVPRNTPARRCTRGKHGNRASANRAPSSRRWRNGGTPRRFRGNCDREQLSETRVGASLAPVALAIAPTRCKRVPEFVKQDAKIGSNDKEQSDEKTPGFLHPIERVDQEREVQPHVDPPIAPSRNA